MRLPVTPRSLVVLLLAALCGCSNDHHLFAPFDPPSGANSPYPASLLAAMAPDSVAIGQSVIVKTYVEYGDCETFDHFEVRVHGDSIAVTPLVAIHHGTPCPAIVRQVEKDCLVTPAGGGRCTLVVRGASGPGSAAGRLVLPITVGAAPALLRRYDVQVADATTQQAVAGASIAILPGGWGATPPDTLAKLTSDANGHASVATPCSGGDGEYRIVVACPGYYEQTFLWSPAGCGVAERGTLLIAHYPTRTAALLRDWF